MGQMVLGVMLGAKMTLKMEQLCNEVEGIDETLLETWNSEQLFGTPKITTAALGYDDAVLGVWLVSHLRADDDSIPIVEGPISLAALRRSMRGKAANKAWTALTKWADKRKIKLPKPEIFLAPLEVP